MKTKVLLFVIFAITLFSLGALITVIFNSQPNTAEVLIMFYLCLFLTVFGVVFYAIFGLLYWREGMVVPGWSGTSTTSRLALIAASMTVISLLLRSYDLLNVATVLVILAGAAIFELSSRRRFIKR